MKGLTKEQFEDLDDWVNEIEIDEEYLESAKWDRNIYGVEPQYSVGGWVYDEDEYYQAQVDKAIDYLKSDGWGGYFEYDDDQDETELTQRAIVYLLMKQSFCIKGKKDEED